MGLPFKNCGYPGYPFVSNIHTLAFYSREFYNEQREAWNVLSKEASDKGDSAGLVGTINGLSDLVKDDLGWRSRYRVRDLNFREMTKADFPYILSHRSAGDLNPRNEKLPQKIPAADENMISRISEFEGSVLMISHLRVFHRSDGFLLTFSPKPGVDYLGCHFKNSMNPARNILDNPHASAIAHTAATFLDSGTQRWHRKTVEWLAVYLLTEVLAAPNNHRHGCSMLSLPNAYHLIAIDLVRLKRSHKMP